MGTFFDVVAVAELKFDPDESFIVANEIVYNKDTNFISALMEYSQAIGFKIIIQHASDYFYFRIERAESEPNRLTNDAIKAATQVLLSKICNIYSTFINKKTSNDSENIDPNATIPIINHGNLRNFGAKNTEKIDLAGVFLLEIKEEMPQLVNQLLLADRQTFEKGVKLYEEVVNERSNTRLTRAKQRQLEAEAIEAEAQQITEEALNKTDAALGAEETAQGLQRLTLHWREKAGHHRNRRVANFRVFAGVLIVALILLFLSQTGILRTTFYHLCGDAPLCPTPWQRLFADLRLSAQANGSWILALLSLKGVLIPILGVAWLLRILSRQIQSHFVLENDAQHRLALLVSFVRLEELPEVKLTEAERLMILTELFRPTDHPVHHDGPPNITELIAKIKP